MLIGENKDKKTDSNAQTIEEVNIYEFLYQSEKTSYVWKKREVALYLMGSFSEDISMFRQRHPEQTLQGLLDSVLKVEDMSKELKNIKFRYYMKGRVLWTANQLSEIVPRDY